MGFQPFRSQLVRGKVAAGTGFGRSRYDLVATGTGVGRSWYGGQSQPVRGWVAAGTTSRSRSWYGGWRGARALDRQPCRPKRGVTNMVAAGTGVKRFPLARSGRSRYDARGERLTCKTKESPRRRGVPWGVRSQQVRGCSSQTAPCLASTRPEPPGTARNRPERSRTVRKRPLARARVAAGTGWPTPCIGRSVSALARRPVIWQTAGDSVFAATAG